MKDHSLKLDKKIFKQLSSSREVIIGQPQKLISDILKPGNASPSFSRFTQIDDLVPLLQRLFTSLTHSGKFFKLTARAAIPPKLLVDEELFISILTNLFSIAMNSMEKGTIYILIRYDYRKKCLKVEMEQQGKITDHAKMTESGD